MASAADNTKAALEALAAPGPYLTGTLHDRQRLFLLAKTGRTSGSVADLMVAAGIKVTYLVPSNLVVLP
jgi:hypothetical protein